MKSEQMAMGIGVGLYSPNFLFFFDTLQRQATETPSRFSSRRSLSSGGNDKYTRSHASSAVTRSDKLLAAIAFVHIQVILQIIPYLTVTSLQKLIDIQAPK